MFQRCCILTESDCVWVGSCKGGNELLKYLDESSIIRTVGTHFAVGYTAGWAWQDTQAILLDGHDKIHKLYCWMGMTRYTRYTAGWAWQDTHGILLDGHDKIHTVYCWMGMTRYTRYTAGWAWQDTHGILLSYHCGAGVTLIVHFCHEFYAINMDTPHLICTKNSRGQWYIFMGRRCTRCWNA
jgi:hypothetical protein